MMNIGQLNNMLTQVHNFIQPLAEVEIEHEVVGGRLYVDMLDNNEQVLLLAGVPINVRIWAESNTRFIKLQKTTFGCQWANHLQSRVCLVIDYTKKDKIIPMHSYGFGNNSGPQSKLVVLEGQDTQLQELLYVLDEPTARAMSHQICERQALHNCIEASNLLIDVGHQLYQSHCEAYVPELDDLRLRFYGEFLLLDQLMTSFKQMETFLTHAVVYRPKEFDVKNAQQMPEPIVRPVPPLQLQHPEMIEGMVNIEVKDIDEMHDFQVLEDITNSQLYQNDWHNHMFVQYVRPDNSITISQTGNQTIRFSNRQPIDIGVEIMDDNTIRLMSDSFTFHGYIEKHNLLVQPLNPDAPQDKWVIIRSTKKGTGRDSLYSCGIHGNHPIIGINGWQTMPMRFAEVDDGSERVFFVTRAMAAELRQLFEVEDVMEVYRNWFDDLKNYVSLLLEMQRFARGMADENAILELQLIGKANWLDNVRQQLYDNYLVLEKLEKFYRHSVMIPDKPYYTNPIVLSRVWPKLDINSADLDSEQSEKPVDVQFDKPVDIPVVDIPLKDIPVNIPENIPEDIPVYIPEQLLEVILEEIPENIPEDLPADMPAADSGRTRSTRTGSGVRRPHKDDQQNGNKRGKK